jgi:phosphohistidine phosphatase
MDAKYVWILRHAKAVREAPNGRDIERPLAERGINDARRLSSALTAGTITPSRAPYPKRVLCSPSTRTTQTASLVLTPLNIAIATIAKLYAADAETLFSVLAEETDGDEAVGFVGHNPGLAEFTFDLISNQDRPLLETQGFPTATLAVVELPISSWSEVSVGQGKLLGLFHPPY